MVLSGWTEATSVVKDDKKSNANAGSTSGASELEAEKNNEIESGTGKKRKLSEVSEAVNPDMSSVAGDTRSQGKLEVLDDDEDDIVMFDDWESATNKRKRLQ
jgi:ubiquitin-like 1-activating enzyme E1 B